jgi:transcriptional antiterminator RfaH
MSVKLAPPLLYGSDTITVCGTQWFLLRTNAGRERVALNQVTQVAAEVLLPLIQLNVRRWGKLVKSVGPLFPGYLFAKFDFECHYANVRYARGIRGLVSFGTEPAVVPDWIINQLRQRCASGPVEVPRRILTRPEQVTVIGGLFSTFEGIFDRYISGRERVVILLSAMHGGARVILPARMVAPFS